MNKEQIKKFLYDVCEEFNPAKSLDEYTAMIRQYLVLCDWHYTESQASSLVKQYSSVIREAYEAQETVGDVAMDIGYCCG